MLFGLLFDAASACSDTLFISAEGEICDGDIHKCQKQKTTTFNFQTGKTFCFKDTSGNDFSVSIISMSKVATYKRLYDTLDFQIQVDAAKDHCGNWGENCKEGHCSLGSRHPEFKDVPDNKIQGFTCETTSSCQTWCIFADFSCTYLHWWLEPIGNIARVYKYTDAIWEVKLETQHGEIKKTLKLSLDNPTFGLDTLGLTANKTIPISIDSVEIPGYSFSDKIIVSQF